MKLYIFGKEYGRYESSFVEGTVELSIINQVRDLKVMGDDDALEDFIEDQNGCAADFLYALLEEGSEFNIDDLENKGHAYAVAEEFQAGVGKTADLAKVGFVYSEMAC